MRGCVVCGLRPVDRCHIKTRGSGGSWDENNIFYACRTHHQEQHRIGLVAFHDKYMSVALEFDRMGWQIEDHFGVRRLRRRE